MITKTSKAVLTPLADAVTALIVIISDSEIAGTPTPDLSQLSKVVDAQIKNLTVVANKITMQPNADPALKITMQIACTAGELLAYRSSRRVHHARDCI